MDKLEAQRESIKELIEKLYGMIADEGEELPQADAKPVDEPQAEEPTEEKMPEEEPADEGLQSIVKETMYGKPRKPAGALMISVSSKEEKPEAKKLPFKGKKKS